MADNVGLHYEINSWLFRISAIPATILYFTAYDNFSRYLRKKIDNQWAPPLLAGTIARTSAVILVSPLGTIFKATLILLLFRSDPD